MRLIEVTLALISLHYTGPNVGQASKYGAKVHINYNSRNTLRPKNIGSKKTDSAPLERPHAADVRPIRAKIQIQPAVIIKDNLDKLCCL